MINDIKIITIPRLRAHVMGELWLVDAAVALGLDLCHHSGLYSILSRVAALAALSTAALRRAAAPVKLRASFSSAPPEGAPARPLTEEATKESDD